MNIDISFAQKCIEENEIWLDSIRGSLIGGAAGDALGFPVEFLSSSEISDIYPDPGISDYHLDENSGRALISDDTQMTLFTANGLLYRATRLMTKGIAYDLEHYVWLAYKEWLGTQTGKFPEKKICWISDIAELRASRGPGTTCLTALSGGVMGTIEEPVNISKGCGGIMRVAPVALYTGRQRKYDGAKTADITHGHPLGYMSAEALSQILHRVVFGKDSEEKHLSDIIAESGNEMYELFNGTEFLMYLLEIMDLAQKLALNDDDDKRNISRIGEGWVAEEALGIAIYCSLRYYNDFSKAIIAAVNHEGDSDSTGAITGNIVGAHVGYSNIPLKWKTHLELHDTILEIADDLCHDCQISDKSSYRDKAWENKYL